MTAYALNTNGYTITLAAGSTLTIGDGTDAAGLILASGSAISGGILAFGTSQGVIWLSGSNPTISSEITGSGGLTFAGSGAVTITRQPMSAARSPSFRHGNAFRDQRVRH